jgi:putative transposase
LYRAILGGTLQEPGVARRHGAARLHDLRGSEPIRAGIATTPESSDFTALQERIGITPCVAQDLGSEIDDAPVGRNLPSAPLLPFATGIRQDTPDAVIPFAFTDYLELVDWTGRAVVEGKRGSIPSDLPPILERLAVDPAQWLKAAGNIEARFFHAIGPESKLDALCARLKRRWMQGTRACRELYRTPVRPDFVTTFHISQ